MNGKPIPRPMPPCYRRAQAVGVMFAKQLGRRPARLVQFALHPVRQAEHDEVTEGLRAQLPLEQLRYSGVFEAVAIRKCGPVPSSAQGIHVPLPLPRPEGPAQVVPVDRSRGDRDVQKMGTTELARLRRRGVNAGSPTSLTSRWARR